MERQTDNWIQQNVPGGVNSKFDMTNVFTETINTSARFFLGG